VGDELRAQVGGNIEGEANVAASKGVQINRNVVNVDADALEDVKAEIRDIKLKYMFVERDISDLKEGQKENRALHIQVNAKVDTIIAAQNHAQTQPVTIRDVIVAIAIVIIVIAIAIFIGIYIGGLGR